MSDRASHYEVYVTSSGGGAAHQITHTPGGAHNPSWSPNGGKIAFTSYLGGQWQIGVVNSGGGGQRMLTSSSGDNTDPAWSPDGKKIAFESTRDNASTIYVMNGDGSAQKRSVLAAVRTEPVITRKTEAKATLNIMGSFL